MSWLGVNLNDGLNSIKGQLSTITRSVLSEDLDDIDGDESQVIVPRDRIKELEALCQLQKHELDEGRCAREEVEERLQAAHMTTAHQTETLRSQLHHTQTELQELREKASEWGWEAGEGNVGTSGHSTNHQQHQYQQLDQEQLKEFARQEQLNQKLSRQVEELEGELTVLRNCNHHPPGSEEGKAAHLTPTFAPTPAIHNSKSENDEAGRGDANDTLEVWERERAELQYTVSTLHAQLQAVQEDASGLEAGKVEELREHCATLQSENQCHLRSLEELDTQHQAAVEQILKKKSQVQEEAQALRESYREVTQQLALAQVDKQHPEEQFLVAKQQLERQLQNLQTELENVRQEKDTVISTLKSDLDSTVLEKAELKTELCSKSASLNKLEEDVQMLEKEKEKLCNNKVKVEDELKIVSEREQLQCALLQDSNKYQEELLTLQKKYEDVCDCNTGLKETLEKIKHELEETRLSKAEVNQSYELSEQRENDQKVLTDLNQKIASNMEIISKLALAAEIGRSTQEEDDINKKTLEEKLSILEVKNNSLEQELQNSIHSLNDSRASSEILESRLQANAQELVMAKTSLTELDAKLRQIDTDLTTLRKAKAEEDEEVKKTLESHNKECGEGGGGGVGALIRVLGEAVWQRDTLEHHVATLTHQLREKTDLLGEAEMARSEVERECEDLRDQLEEIQKGVRPPPEGSCRGLPTIEEEETEGGEAEGGAVAEEEESKGGKVREIKDRRREEQRYEKNENYGEIQALQAQVEVLSEVRGNLEVEVSNLQGEREGLLGQLRQAEGRTGNLANLETEAASLRGQKQSLERQLETLTQEMDLATVTLQDERDTVRDQVTTLVERLEAMQAEMTLFQHERESIGQQLLAQYAAVEEKDAIIRVLEGELEGLKSTLREKFLTSSESEECRLQRELDSVKSQIIYKDDKIDALSQNLQQFAEIFKIGDYVGADDMFRKIKGKYVALEKSLKENEAKIEELTKLKDHMHEEFESSKIQVLEIEASKISDLERKEKELCLTKDMLEKSEMEVFQLREKLEEVVGDGNNKEASVNKLREELDTTRFEMKDAITNFTQTKEELTSLQSTFDSERSLVVQLRRENEKLMSQKEEIVMELSQALSEKDGLLGEKQSRISVLLSQIEELEGESSNDTASIEVESMRAENEKLNQEKAELQEKLERITKKLEEAETEMKEMKAGMEVAVQQVGALQGERDHLIAAITQKHQESLSYHAEIQRLTQVLAQTSQQSNEHQAKLSAEVRESEGVLGEARAQVASLKEQLHALTTTNTELQRNAADGIIHKTEMAGLRKEMEALKGKLSSFEQERDHLRVANSHFNTQYQDQAKELSTVREREGRLSVECERLRQHLVTVEETYTGEALKAEEREATLRSTLAKMEEKLTNHSTFYTNANQRASVQVETLQEEVREMTSQRDDAILHLHAAEEAAHTSQKSLSTLQQVLQDFQKNQVREISEATERTRRQLEEEQSKGSGLSSQLNALKGQLSEAQGGLAAAGRLGEQLARKEQMIIALRAQVTSQEEVARRARDEVACLRTSSEGKVDKPLLRNLLVGYFATPGDKRAEVLRVISEVLDFSGEERSRTGLDTIGSSWLSSIANFLAPPASNVRVTSKVDVLDHSSLSQAFIRFLEDESNPRPQARLPAVQMAQQTTEKAEKKAQAKAQAASKINPFVSTGSATTPSDSGSRNSSPLLAAASSTPTLPTITPTPPTITPTPATASAPPLATPSPISTTKYLSNLLTSDKDVENGSKQEG